MEEFKKEVLDDFKNRLLKLNEEIIKVEEKSRKKGDKFNIFSILGIQRKEVETHSFLLYDLINPNGSHYQGDLYLRIFLKEILKEKDDFKIYNLLDNAKNIKVAQFFKNREKNLDKLVSVNVGDLKMQNALIEVAENLRREINEVL